MGGNNDKPTRVKDPIQHLLMVIAIGLASWALTQVQEHSKALSAISMQIRHLEVSLSAVETRSERATDTIQRDIREIRTFMERKQ